MACKVLAVDDEPYMNRLLQQQLERAAFQMLDAYDGCEALELAGRDLPNLSVMDVMMAEMDGLSALKQLNKTDTKKAIPVVMITASMHQMTRQGAELSGEAFFLAKPISPTQLLAALRTLVPEARKG